MKKKLVFLLAMSLTGSIIFSGCNSNTEASNDTKTVVTEKTETPKTETEKTILPTSDSESKNLNEIKKYAEHIDKLAILKDSKNIDLNKIASDLIDKNEEIKSISMDSSKIDFAKKGSYPATVSMTKKTNDNITATVNVAVVEKEDLDSSTDLIIIGDDNKIMDKDSILSKETVKDDKDKKDDKKKDDKKKDNTKEDKKEVNSDNKKGSDNADKDNKPASKPNKPAAKPDKPATKPDKPATKPDKHQHNWQPVYKTVHHDEQGHYETINHEAQGHYENKLIEEAYDEPIYEIHDICSICGADLTALGEEPWEHGQRHALAGEGAGGHHTGQVLVKTIHHDAEYDNVWVEDKAAWSEQKWIVDRAAYDEQVVDHYECSCGARK